MSELFESLGRDNGFVFDLSKYLVIMAVSDAVLYLAVPSLRKARWKVLHAIANFMVTVLSLKDAYDTVIDPIESCKGRAGIDYSIQPIYMVAALHIYHMIPGLGFRVGFSDYFHHIVFAGSICSVGMLYESGPLQNFIALFICGLPGGLDYIMLVMVKMGKMLPKREKVLNARINLWLRAPGLTASTLFVYITARYGGDASPCSNHPFLAALIAFLIFFNGQYYLNVVVGNTTRKVETYNS